MQTWNCHTMDFCVTDDIGDTMQTWTCYDFAQSSLELFALTDDITDTMQTWTGCVTDDITDTMQTWTLCVTDDITDTRQTWTLCVTDDIKFDICYNQQVLNLLCRGWDQTIANFFDFVWLTI